jgi:hypothetical protein
MESTSNYSHGVSGFAAETSDQNFICHRNKVEPAPADYNIALVPDDMVDSSKNNRLFVQAALRPPFQYSLDTNHELEMRDFLSDCGLYVCVSKLH